MKYKVKKSFVILALVLVALFLVGAQCTFEVGTSKVVVDTTSTSGATVDQSETATTVNGSDAPAGLGIEIPAGLVGDQLWQFLGQNDGSGLSPEGLDSLRGMTREEKRLPEGEPIRGNTDGPGGRAKQPRPTPEAPVFLSTPGRAKGQ